MPVSLVEGMGSPGAATTSSGGVGGQDLSVPSVFPVLPHLQSRGVCFFVLKDSRGGTTKAMGSCFVQSLPGWQSPGFSG